MADIAAFRGIHFNPGMISDLSSVVSPPYDIISPAERDRLYARDVHNIVRIILPGTEPGEDPSEGHARAGDLWRTWRNHGILVEDPDPALYVYRQTFVSPISRRRTERTGFLCALKLAPYSEGVVLPHEHTRPAAKADRLGLMRATAANAEPIMGLYDDPDQRAMTALLQQTRDRKPMLHAEVDEGVHEVWSVTDAQTIAEVQTALADRRIWIADGHHRYETALTYSSEQPGADRIMIALIPFDDPGLVVLPTHRMIRGLTEGQVDGMMEDMSGLFAMTAIVDRTEVADMASGMRSSDGSFIVVSRDKAFHAALRDRAAMLSAAADRSDAWRSLDVSILQALVLDPLIANVPSVQITYTRHPDEAVERAESGDISAAFIVGYPSPDDLRAVTSSGDRMPPKSTYFEPKLWSGLLMRRLDGS